MQPVRRTDKLLLMTTASTATLKADVKVISLVGIAHGLSHFFQLCIPPLFPLIKEEFGVSYAALGAVLAVFYAVSGVMQTAAGFLVDRCGARVILLAGLALASIGTLLAGMAPSFGWLFATAVVAGLGNSVFHPADLALLNGKVNPKRLGHAFSVHGIVGNIGWVLAPIFTLPIAQAYGWRYALMAAGAMGLVFFGALATQRVLGGERRFPRAAGTHARGGLRADLALLASPPILMCFFFFFLYAMTLVGFQTFSTAALSELYGITLTAATSALTAFLVGGAFGILFGGFVVSRTNRYNLIAAIGMVFPAGLALAIASGALATGLLVATMALAGFIFGSIGPARDIIVRTVAPQEARGKVYGFVYSGLDLAGLVAPLLFGWALDRGRPELVFVGATLCMLVAVPTVIRLRRRPPRAVQAPA
jgi:FSR family fosmidomycin resistance protein-like MFS transporter